MNGSADGAAEGISWQSVLPRARLHWRTRETGSTTMFVGYTRSAYRLPLDLLAFGDPAGADGERVSLGGHLSPRRRWTARSRGWVPAQEVAQTFPESIPT